MKLKVNKEIIANIAIWVLLLTVFISLKVQLFPITKAVVLSFGSVLLLAGTAYFNALVIIPRFFQKRKFGQYFLMVIGLLTIVILCYLTLTRFWSLDVFPDGRPWQQDRTLPKKIGYRAFRAVPLFLLTVATLFISTLYKLAKEFLREEHRSTHLEKEKIRHELNFLRSQINPHFLFNALNNLHATVQLKPEKAGDYILKLGEMLRYVLEECKKEKVSLTDEIKYIENYIFFQKQKDDDFQNIQFEVKGDDPSSFYLEPMLFIALVENAFEHSYSEQSENRHIIIQMELKADVLKFTTRNNVSEDEKPPPTMGRNQSGVGLQNIKRRLELLYPEAHTLQHEKRNGEIYETELIIKKSPI